MFPTSFFSGKKVFVTGHTGFKGSWLSCWLAEMGAGVTGYSKDIPTSPSLFETLGLKEKIEDIRGDLKDLDLLRAALENSCPDLVFHLAAQPLVRFSYDNPVATFADNVLGTAHLLEALRLYGKARAAVIVTTDKVYENKNWEFGYRENDELGGHDPYSASKAAAEIVTSSYVRSFFAEGTRIATARAGNVIGGGDWAADRLVPDCVRAWMNGEAVKIRNPNHTRPWEHVLEPLGAYLLLAAKLAGRAEGTHGQSFNFGPESGANFSAGEMVTHLEKRWPHARHEYGLPELTPKKEAATLRLNCDRAYERLGWRPTLNTAEAISWTADWYQAFAADASSAAKLTISQIKEFQSRMAL